MELKNICVDINSTESLLIQRITHILLAGLVIYSGVWIIRRFKLQWYSIIIITPIILLLAWNTAWFSGIPIHYGCKLFELNE